MLDTYASTGGAMFQLPAVSVAKVTPSAEGGMLQLTCTSVDVRGTPAAESHTKN